MGTEMTDPYTLVLFTAQSGALSARLEHDDGSLLHLHSIVAPEKETRYFSDLCFWGDRIVLSGCGLGYHLKRALESVQRGTRVLLVEYYKELAVRCLEQFPANVREQVTLITRETGNTEEMITRFLSSGTYLQVVKHPPSMQAHREFYREILGICSNKPSVNRPVDSVMLLLGDFFLEKELAAAAEKEQVRTVPFAYKKWSSVTAYESELQQLLQKQHPQAVLSINLLGIDGNGILAEYCQRAGVPLLVWFVDDPRPMLNNRKGWAAENVIAFTWERDYLPWLQNRGFGEVRYLPLATDASQFVPGNATRATVTCGFVGTAMGKSFLSEIARKFIWKPEYAPLAAAVAQHLLSGAKICVDELINDECDRRSVVLPDDGAHTFTWLRSYIIHTASMLKRKLLVTELLPAGIETFGDPDGWQELIAGGGEGIVTHNNIDYRTELAGIYRSIAVNINCTSCQMPTACNQRVFDVPACGGFILNDAQPDLQELFSPHEYVTYASVNECKDKVAFYNKHDDARTTVAAAARQRIINEHTYNHRLHSLLSL